MADSLKREIKKMTNKELKSELIQAKKALVSGVLLTRGSVAYMYQFIRLVEAEQRRREKNNG